MISDGHCHNTTRTRIWICVHRHLYYASDEGLYFPLSSVICWVGKRKESHLPLFYWSDLNKDENVKLWHFSHCLSFQIRCPAGRPLGGATASGLPGWHDWKYRLTAPGDKNQISVHFDPHPDNHIATLPALMNRLQGPGKAPIIGVRLIIHKWWSQDKHKEFNQPMERTKIRANSWGANNY